MAYLLPQATNIDAKIDTNLGAQVDTTPGISLSDYEPINLAACYDFPVNSPLPDWEEWLAMRSSANPFHGILERKIGNTCFTILTDCAGGELLIRKIKRLIFSEPVPEKPCATVPAATVPTIPAVLAKEAFAQ